MQACEKLKYSTCVFLLLLILCFGTFRGPVAKCALHITKSSLFAYDFLLVAILNLHGLDTDEN